MHAPPTRKEPSPPEDDGATPNPARLPVEPEFAPEVPQGEPGEPGTQPANT